MLQNTSDEKLEVPKTTYTPICSTLMSTKATSNLDLQWLVSGTSFLNQGLLRLEGQDENSESQ